jgi:hypothetical protein
MGLWRSEGSHIDQVCCKPLHSAETYNIKNVILPHSSKIIILISKINRSYISIRNVFNVDIKFYKYDMTFNILFIF